MTLLIFAIIIFAIIIFLAEAGLLLWVKKLFKIENPTYKNSLKILIFYVFASLVVRVIFSIINLGFISNILAIITSFFIFYYFFKKYYSSNWKKTLGIYVVYGIIVLITSLIIVITTRLYIFSPFYAKGVSMSPTYNNGDYLLIDKFNKNFVRGDIVVFKYGTENNTYFIKRIIGLPLEKIDIQNGKILINDQALNNTYYYGEIGKNISTILDQNQYFVLGDNLEESFDSRNFGPISKSNIEGKIFYKVSGVDPKILKIE